MLEVQEIRDHKVKKGGYTETVQQWLYMLQIFYNSVKIALNVLFDYMTFDVFQYRFQKFGIGHFWRINVNIGKFLNFVPLFYWFQCDRVRSISCRICIQHSKSVFPCIVLMYLSIKSEEVTERFWQIIFQLIIYKLAVSNYYNVLKFIDFRFSVLVVRSFSWTFKVQYSQCFILCLLDCLNSWTLFWSPYLATIPYVRIKQGII